MPESQSQRAPHGDGGANLADRLEARILEILDGAADQVRPRLRQLCADNPKHTPTILKLIQQLRPAGKATQATLARFGPYSLLQELGRGGMGVVFRARRDGDANDVALKVIRSRHLANRRAMERFQREYHALSECDHPNLIPVLEAGAIAGKPFFTMAFVEGSNLMQVLDHLRTLGRPARQLDGNHLWAAVLRDRPPCPPPTDWSTAYIACVTRLIAEAADGLDYVHSRNVVHRDVKPTNIMVGLDGRARLFDFGLARVEAAQSLTMTGEFFGTPSYSSPEQIAGRRNEVDARSDVFSLGATLYEMLTLRMPFGPVTSAKPAGLGIDPVPMPLPPEVRNPEVHPRLGRACMRAMSTEREERQRSAAELAAELRQ